MYPLEFDTYTAQSPTLTKNIIFTKEVIWEEIDRILLESKKNKYTPGQNIYYNLAFFCNSKFFFDRDIEWYIQEYYLSHKYNLPIANNIQDANSHTLDIFQVISEELNACEKRAKEINDGK